MINRTVLYNTAFNLGRLDPVVVKDSQLSNSWANINALGGNYSQFKFWVDAFGFRHFEGVLDTGTVGNAAITYADEGSFNTVLLPTISNGSIGRIDITSGGAVQILSPSNNAYVSFDNIYWPVSIEGWNTISYSNSWVDFGPTWLGGYYTKDPLGYTHLLGLIKSGSSGTVTTLGADYRPTRDYDAITISKNALASIKVTTTGVVSFPAYDSAWVSLSGHNWTTQQDDWNNITLAANWSNYDSTEPAQYRVDAHGMMELRGKVTYSGTYSSQSTMFTIPDGATPVGGQIFPTNCYPYMGILTAHVAENGLVKHQVASDPNDWVSLDGIKWRVNMFS